MGEIEDGRYLPEDPEDVVDQMIDRAEDHFGQSLGFDGRSVVRSFYRPIAAGFVDLEQDLREVLSSTQIDHAEGEALDNLTALINVQRRQPEPARGEVVFSSEGPAPTDLLIPEGEVVQTPGEEPKKYETTDVSTIEEGETEASVPVVAVEEGPEHNVSEHSVTEFESRPSGVEGVTNPEPISGGESRETDEELRERAKSRLADGSGASRAAIISAIERAGDGIRKVDMFVNSKSTEDGGLPPHSFEPVIEAPEPLYDDIAQAIMDTKAAGDEVVGGVNGAEASGEAVLPTGDSVTVPFSIPEEVQIYVDVDIDVHEKSFGGESAVKDNVVDYIGGNYADGTGTLGEIASGDDVVIGEVEYAIRETEGVYDVRNLTVDTEETDGNTENIPISKTEAAILEADDKNKFSLGVEYV